MVIKGAAAALLFGICLATIMGSDIPRDNAEHIGSAFPEE